MLFIYHRIIHSKSLANSKVNIHEYPVIMGSLLGSMSNARRLYKKGLVDTI